MTTYTKLPETVEAVQFTGDNWAEMHAFTGHRHLEGQTESDGRAAYADVFNEIGTYLPKDEHPGAVAELWNQVQSSHVPIYSGMWVIKDGLGFYRVDKEYFANKYVLKDDFAMMFQDSRNLDVPILDQEADDARMLGRVRMALLLTRPLSEVDAICERMIIWRTYYKIATEPRTP